MAGKVHLSSLGGRLTVRKEADGRLMKEEKEEDAGGEYPCLLAGISIKHALCICQAQI